MEWVIQKSDFFESRFRRFQKKHPNEALAVLNNLDTYLTVLKTGINPLNIKLGFLHNEPNGIKAIDQKGGKGKLKQTRLYVFSDATKKVLHLINIGDKTDQNTDIQECRKFIKTLK